jgi:hypothetical protein
MHMHAEGAFVSRRAVIQSGLLLAAGCAASLPALRSEEPAPAGEKKSWTIANGSISRTLAFQPGLGLWTDRFSDRETSVDFIEPDKIRKGMAEEFYFQCNGRHCAGVGPDFLLLDAGEASFFNGNSLTVRLRHRSLALEVSVVYAVYNGHAAVRKHLVLKNTGTEALHFSHLAIEALGISIVPEN